MISEIPGSLLKYFIYVHVCVYAYSSVQVQVCAVSIEVPAGNSRCVRLPIKSWVIVNCPVWVL